MSAKLKAIKKIENLTVEELSETLQYNGYPDIGNVVLLQKIGGKEFLKLTESDVRSWKLNPAKTIFFRSYLLRVVEHPEDFLIKTKHNGIGNTNREHNSDCFKTQTTNKLSPALPPKQIVKPMVKQTQNSHLKINNAALEEEENQGYMLPNDFNEPQENYEPAPILNEENKHSYREMKLEVQKKIFQSRNNLHNLRERPLPPIPFSVNLKEEEPNEDLPDYIEIDEKHTKKVKRTEICVPTTSKALNLPMPPKSFPVTTTNILEKSNSCLIKELNSLNNFGLKFPETGRGVRQRTFKELISDIQNNPFYRNTDRKGARLILNGLIDGAFLIRPPSKSYFLSIIVVKKGKKMFNIGIEQTPGEMTLQVNSVGDTQTFDNMGEIIDNFCKEPLIILDNESNEKVEVLLKKVLQ